MEGILLVNHSLWQEAPLKDGVISASHCDHSLLVCWETAVGDVRWVTGVLAELGPCQQMGETDYDEQLYYISNNSNIPIVVLRPR